MSPARSHPLPGCPARRLGCLPAPRTRRCPHRCLQPVAGQCSRPWGSAQHACPGCNYQRGGQSGRRWRVPSPPTGCGFPSSPADRCWQGDRLRAQGPASQVPTHGPPDSADWGPGKCHSCFLQETLQRETRKPGPFAPSGDTETAPSNKPALLEDSRQRLQPPDHVPSPSLGGSRWELQPPDHVPSTLNSSLWPGCLLGPAFVGHFLPGSAAGQEESGCPAPVPAAHLVQRPLLTPPSKSVPASLAAGSPWVGRQSPVSRGALARWGAHRQAAPFTHAGESLWLAAWLRWPCRGGGGTWAGGAWDSSEFRSEMSAGRGAGQPGPAGRAGPSPTPPRHLP